MDRQDKELVRLLNSAKKGNKDSYERLCELIYNEVYNLVAFIYTSRETRVKLTKHVLVRIYKNLDDFDAGETDVHLWIARFTTLEVYRICVMQNGELFGACEDAAEYGCESVEDDEELARCASEYNEAFLDRNKLEEILIDFKDMTKGQKILYQMFCYESYTLDEIEDLLEVDSTFLAAQLTAVRTKLGLSDISLSGEVSEDVLAGGVETAHAEAASNGEDGDIQADAYIETDDNIQYDDEDEDLRTGTEASKSRKAEEKPPLLGFIPDKVLIGITAAATGLIVILSVVLVISIGKNNRQETKGVVNQSRATASADINRTTQSTNASTAEEASSETDEQTTADEGRTTQQTPGDGQQGGGNNNNAAAGNQGGNNNEPAGGDNNGGSGETPGGGDESGGGSGETPGGGDEGGGSGETPGGGDEGGGGSSETPGGGDERGGGSSETPSGGDESGGGSDETPSGGDEGTGASEENSEGTD